MEAVRPVSSAVSRLLVIGRSSGVMSRPAVGRPVPDGSKSGVSFAFLRFFPDQLGIFGTRLVTDVTTTATSEDRDDSGRFSGPDRDGAAHARPRLVPHLARSSGAVAAIAADLGQHLSGLCISHHPLVGSRVLDPV